MILHTETSEKIYLLFTIHYARSAIHCLASTVLFSLFTIPAYSAIREIITCIRHDVTAQKKTSAIAPPFPHTQSQSSMSERPCPNFSKWKYSSTTDSTAVNHVADNSFVPFFSNLGFGLLGQGLAFSQNASFEEWMKNNIFDPLEMYDSGFQLTREWVSRLIMQKFL